MMKLQQEFAKMLRQYTWIFSRFFTTRSEFSPKLMEVSSANALFPIRYFGQALRTSTKIQGGFQALLSNLRAPGVSLLNLSKLE